MMKPCITYQLTIQVRQDSTIQIGKLGAFHFPAGYYVYTGSAKRNLEARIQRHLSKEKRLKWHIDYLLHAPEVEVIKVGRWTESECEVNQQVHGNVLIPRFGATDCHSGCGSHLKFLSKLDAPLVPTP
ncbi:MAG: GIY-YIG nuclease family protein [Methylotenera sp.]|nr:GIY-YIG nuclease family protein [Methylotenera sp.]MDP2280925.1 GIY-YIG nuclease family protein [Methylotenera sp.]MDP3303394.1 GIY-YIG nuclease family protein [Methylotenera sp.]